mmetsp:Transcript_5618/g.23131  ORF Transcript_5618/g.23131 Transcript_5618/m.23131 type:complete len:234 (-) Transcript_5618:2047-2748(-)
MVELCLLILICVAAIIAASGQGTFTAANCVLALLYILSYVATASATRYTARRYCLSSSEILHGVLPYAVFWTFLWLAIVANLDNRAGPCTMPSKLWIFLLLNCCLAVSVQFLTTWTMKTVNVTLYAVLGQVKTAMTVLLGSLIFGESISTRTGIAFTLIILLGGTLTVVNDFDKFKDGICGTWKKQWTKSNIVYFGSLFLLTILLFSVPESSTMRSPWIELFPASNATQVRSV